jgi:hypothetical protein
MSAPNLEDPQLAPPGAGLPPAELFIARLLFRLQRWTGSPDAFTSAFKRERSAIRALYQPCDASAGAQQVLIPRIPGIEDSSRYWSVWMTLDHLRIVNCSIAGIILKLSKGEIPPGQASTAAVKPSPGAGVAVAPEYEASCDFILKVIGRVPKIHPKTRFAHPWFGPLDVFGWHAIAASHMAIHRRQIQKILSSKSGRQ